MLLLLALACRHAPPAPAVTAAEPPVEVAPAPQPAPPPSDWQAPLGHDHPWLGRIWSESDQRWIEPATLIDRLRDVEVVLLGEIHDHPDHHRLQAWILAELATPDHAVVFEQLTTAQQVDAADPAELAAVSGWAETGWPDFELYRPVLDAVYEAGATVVAGHPTRDQVRTAMTEGLDALPAAVVEDLPLRPLPGPMRSDLEDVIVQSHCGMFNEALLISMTVAQTFKDAHMARAIERAGPPAVLIAGNGHVRPDRGVPHYLSSSALAVALLEVEGAPTADDRPEVDGAGDFAWFTARRHDDDPCERFRTQREGTGRTR